MSRAGHARVAAWTVTAALAAAATHAQELTPRRAANIRPIDPAAPVSESLSLPDVKIVVSPNPPVRGDVSSVTIEIPNRTSRAWEVSISAELNPSALLYRATDGPSVRWRTTEAFLGLTWPPLVVPARTIANVRYDVILRYDTLAPPVVTNVRLDAQDAETRTGQTGIVKDVQIDPVVD